MNRNTKEDHARTNRAGQHWMVERMPLDWQLKNRAEPHADRGRRNALHDQRVCQTRWQMQWNTENTKLHPTEGCQEAKWMLHKNDRPTEEPTTSRHEWTGEEVTTPYDGHPEVRTQEGHRRECNREGRLEVKEENHQERRGNRSHDWKGHDQDRPYTHERERKPEMTKIWRNLQATDCRKGNPPHGKRKIERDKQCERIVHNMGPECCSPPSWPPCTRCNPTTGECTTTPPH